MSRVVRKDPDADRTFEVDWSPVLGALTISASSWTVPSGVVSVANSFAGAIADITLNGGTAREIYELENTITDSGGDDHNASLFVLVEELLAESVQESEAVLLSDAKLYLRVTHDDEDVRIRDLIQAATDFIETQVDRDFLCRVRTLQLCGFPYEIEIPRPPTQAVLRIQYYDADNVLQTLATTEWYSYSDGEYTRVLPEYGKSWPGTADRPDAVFIEYESGYGNTSDDVPARGKQAILMVARHWYDNPSAVVTGTISTEVKLAVASLCRSLNPGTYL